MSAAPPLTVVVGTILAAKTKVVMLPFFTELRPPDYAHRWLLTGGETSIKGAGESVDGGERLMTPGRILPKDWLTANVLCWTCGGT